MKKNLLIFFWALAPVALLAYHYGPGQTGLAREEAKASIQAALEFEKNEQWQQAIDAYDEALAALPEEETARRMQLQLARANARIYVGELPEAMFAMEQLLDEAAKGDDKKLENKVRASLASAQYYTGWLMRLELAEKEEWMEPVEKARQTSACSPSNPPKPIPSHPKSTKRISRPSFASPGWISQSCRHSRSPRNVRAAKTSAPSAGARKRATSRSRAKRRRTPAERALASAPTEPAPDRQLMISI